jgi:hypothetical protein
MAALIVDDLSVVLSNHWLPHAEFVRPTMYETTLVALIWGFLFTAGIATGGWDFLLIIVASLAHFGIVISVIVGLFIVQIPVLAPIPQIVGTVWFPYIWPLLVPSFGWHLFFLKISWHLTCLDRFAVAWFSSFNS